MGSVMCGRDRSVVTTDVIFDDDSAGEAADIVALRVAGPRLLVRLIHCKFSKTTTPGRRVKDLYEVCGQSQRSGARRENLAGLLEHLERREARRIKKVGQPSRFEIGDRRVLRSIKNRLPELTPELQVLLVQPGLARGAATPDQLDLLAVTEHFLRDSYAVPLRVIGSH